MTKTKKTKAVKVKKEKNKAVTVGSENAQKRDAHHSLVGAPFLSRAPEILNEQLRTLEPQPQDLKPLDPDELGISCLTS